ncbi:MULTISPECIES: hypothetical protein [Mycolicibacterium]|uniref:hypothetical protein n=1 Tax=Mycolicibacterium TaxID=1866885 RepID=UPI0018D535E0|nr:hypothetical protein [Mycolicibacterium chitae]
MPILLLGYGPVGRHYARLVRENRELVRERYGCDLHIAGIRTSSRELMLGVGATGPPSPQEDWQPRASLTDALATIRPRVAVQAVPSDAHRAKAALSDALAVLTHGAHLVTATKSPLLSGWSELQTAARRASRAIRISGATGAALPAGDFARTVLRGFDVDEVRGCLNGTATFVLDTLAEGETLAAAVKVAQRKGIAEADPSADLSGADAATKLRLLTALLWQWDPADCDGALETIDQSTAGRAVRARRHGAVVRHVAAARLENPGVVEVSLREFDSSQLPFGVLRGPEKAVTFSCGDAGEITVSGGRSSPVGAARAMFKDTLALLPGSGSGFF